MEGFIVDSQYHVEPEGAVVYLYGRLKNGDSFLAKTQYNPYFYIKTEDLEHAKEIEQFKFEETTLKTFEKDPVTKIILTIPRNVASMRDTFLDAGIACYEADIPFTSRFLIDHKINGSLKIEGEWQKGERVDRLYQEPNLQPSSWNPNTKDLKTMSIDIETASDHSSLYCISATVQGKDPKTFVVKKETDAAFTGSINEVLETFSTYVEEEDPDIITGWNVIDFDLERIQQLCKENNVTFDLGRRRESSKLQIQDSFIRDSSATLEGRMVLDGIHLLKNNFIKLHDYKLETAAKEFTDEGKIFSGESKSDDIKNAYENDIDTLITYNQKDTTLVLEILEESDALPVTIYRSLLTGMHLDRVSASIASFDSLYLKELQNHGYVAPVTSYRQREQTTGGFVMESKAGIYQNVAVCDFKSLYPSIIQTFNIDPVTYVQGDDIVAPNEASFSRDKGILPTLLQRLGTEREHAKKEDKSVKSFAIKILMNSMYGVLASPNCRFYSFEMANAITSFGHMLIHKTTDVLQSYDIIYGDTDSIFVCLGEMETQKAKQEGESISQTINTFYK